MSKTPIFTGSATAIVTPFREDGSLNLEKMGELIDQQAAGGTAAIVVSGTTGENATQPLDEHEELMEFCVKHCAGRMKVVVGVGSNDTMTSIRLARSAEACGADGILMVTPYYNRTNQAGLVQHFTYVADRVSVPMILYNVPSRTGLDMPISVYRKLSRIPKIAGVKEASVDVSKVTKTINECDKGFCVWSGNDELAVTVISVGGQGLISVMSNICPVETNAMVEAALDGDFDTAASLHAQLQPLCELLFCEVNPIPVKAALQYIGYDCGECRLPLCSLSGENRAKMEKFFS
jgi:4-hydroxy-tetrahydrodipicolinate synthase